MKQDETIEMAFKAGVEDSNEYNHLVCTEVELVAFAKLVAAKERDRMCEQCKWSKYENATCNEANQSKILGEG